MANISQQLEDRMDIISKFREEQEAKLLSSFSMSVSMYPPKHSTVPRLSHTSYQSKMILNNKTNKDSIDFFNLIDKNILIVANSVMNASCWPLALISVINENNGKKIDRSADLGTLDSHGSLWKMILRPDAYPGTRIILQNAEIGETSSYLRADLTCHESIETAAIWTVYTVSSSNFQPENTSSLDDSSSNIRQPYEGILVRFELFEGPTAGYGTRSESRYLVSVVSKNLSQGIALMAESEMKEDSKNKDLSFGIQWELIPEDTEIDDPEIDAVLSG